MTSSTTKVNPLLTFAAAQQELLDARCAFRTITHYLARYRARLPDGQHTDIQNALIQFGEYVIPFYAIEVTQVVCPRQPIYETQKLVYNHVLQIQNRLRNLYETLLKPIAERDLGLTSKENSNAKH